MPSVYCPLCVLPLFFLPVSVLSPSFISFCPPSFPLYTMPSLPIFSLFRLPPFYLLSSARPNLLFLFLFIVSSCSSAGSSVRLKI